MRPLLLAALLGSSLVACGSAAGRAGGPPSPGSPAVAPGRLLARTPYVGVACPQPNSIACDLVGLAVWLRAPAAGVSARIDDRPVAFHAGGLGGRGPTYWEGYLRPAGLLDGRLRVTPDAGRYRWAGAHAKRADLVLDVVGRDGVVRRVRLSVGLAPGWG